VAITSRCDEQLGCTFVVWHGAVTPDQWQEHFEGLIADPHFPPGRRWLVDARGANVDLFDEQALAAMGALFNESAERLDGMRLATVPNGAWEKASHLFEHEVSIRGFSAIQFNSVAVACTWLGVPPEDANRALDELRAEARDLDLAE
jgi:hypothetical protein